MGGICRPQNEKELSELIRGFEASEFGVLK